MNTPIHHRYSDNMPDWVIMMRSSPAAIGRSSDEPQWTPATDPTIDGGGDDGQNTRSQKSSGHIPNHNHDPRPIPPRERQSCSPLSVLGADPSPLNLPSDSPHYYTDKLRQRQPQPQGGSPGQPPPHSPHSSIGTDPDGDYLPTVRGHGSGRGSGLGRRRGLGCRGRGRSRRSSDLEKYRYR